MEVLKTKRGVILSTLIALFLVFPFYTHAQDPLMDLDEILDFMGYNDIQNDRFTLEVNPDNPGPGEEVTAEVSGPAFLNNSMIRWYINGAQVLAGYGEKEYELTTGGVGERTVIEVRVQPDDQSGVMTQRIEIRPANVSLVWEADSYTPPYYEGKSLNSPESTITVTALSSFSPGNAVTNEDGLVYTWRVGGEIVENRRRGMNSLTLDPTSFRPPRIEVIVESVTTGARGSDEIQLTRPRSPQIVLYRDNFIEGIRFDHALSDEYTPPFGENIYITAVPYFFSVDRMNDPQLELEWYMNGQELPNQRGAHTAAFGSPTQTEPAEIGASTQRTSELMLRVRHNNRPRQRAEEQVRIILSQ